jgi:hypothetical protein
MWIGFILSPQGSPTRHNQDRVLPCPYESDHFSGTFNPLSHKWAFGQT